MRHSKASLSGIQLIIQSSCAFAVMALCVKIVSLSLPFLEVIFFRSLIGTVIISVFIRQKGVPFLGRERALMTMRGLSGFVALSLYFYTISRLPLGTAVILNYTCPLFAAIFAMGFLGERPSLFLLSMILVAFLGVYLLVDAEFHGWNTAVTLGILSAVFAAIAYVVIRAVKHRESPLTVIFYFTGISTLGSLFYFPFFAFKWPSWADWITLAGVGAGSFYGQLWMTIALRRAAASLVSPFTYLTPLLSFLLGMIFFGEILGWQSAFGAFLIILGGCLVSYFETRKSPRRG